MKKFLTLAAVLVIGFSANNAKAQLTGTATLNVTLAAAQNISVTAPAVILPFTTSAHYDSGVETTATDHITASSTGNYFINVQATGANLVGPGGATIPVTTLSLEPSASTTAAAPGSPTYSNVASLNNTAGQTVVTSTVGANAAKFNIKYKASGGSDYINKPTGTYVATVTYTIAAI